MNMKDSKWLVLVCVIFLLSSLVTTSYSACGAAPAKSTDAGVVPMADPASTDWIPDQRVSPANQQTNQEAVSPSIATAGDGSLWVAYDQWDSVSNLNVIVVSRSTDGGVTWTVNNTIAQSNDVWLPSIAVDPYNNNVYVVFEYDYSSTDHDIRLMLLNSTGWFGKSIDSSTSDDYNPSIVCEYDKGALSGGNYVFVTWERDVSSVDYEIMFSRSTNQGNTWSTPSWLTSHGVGEVSSRPSMTYAGAGKIYIAYGDRDQNSGYSRIRLAASSNEGSDFVARDITSSGDFGQGLGVFEPSITAVHGGTTVVAAWVYGYSSADWDIYYAQSTDNGVTWSSSYGLAISTADETDPQVTVDGMGGTGSYFGNIHATYEATGSSGATTYSIYYTTANYATPTSWSPRVKVSDSNAIVAPVYPYADRAITTVHDTVPVVVWTDDRAGRAIYGTTMGGKYTIDTSPSGLQVSVDGITYVGSVSYYWAYKSAHTVSAPSPQGTLYFRAWNDYAEQTHSVTAYSLGEHEFTAYFSMNAACLVVRGGDNRIYYRTLALSTHTWSGWSALQSGTTLEAPAAALAGNTLHVVVKGSDGNTLWYSSINPLTGTGFSGWTLLSGLTPSPPTLTSNGTHLALVVRGGDNRIYYRLYTIALQAWTGWIALSSGTTMESPAASLFWNLLDIVVKGSDGNTLWRCRLDNPTLGTIRQVYDPISGTLRDWSLYGGSTPSIPTQSSNSIWESLVVRGGDNRIYYSSLAGGWSALPSGTTLESPAATLIANSLHVVVKGSDGNTLWYSNINPNTGAGFSGWSLLSGSTPSKPTLTG